MIGVWVELALTLAACAVAALRTVSLRVERDAVRYTPRHAR